MAVDMNPDLSGLRPYVAWRMRQLHEMAPSAFAEMRGLFAAEWGPCSSPQEALASSERIGWWLHYLAEHRLEALRKREGKSIKARQR